MTIRRLAAAVLAALVVLLGGATLASCSGPVDTTLGTSADNPHNRSGNDPSGVSQGNLPNLSQRVVNGGRSPGEAPPDGG